jgi:predicted PurR-regulated permease PerM
MGSDVLTLANSIAVLVLALMGIILCSAVIVGPFKLYPSLRHIVSNVEKTTESSAMAAENAAIISRSLAERSDEIADNVATATHNTREATASTAKAASDIAGAASLLGPAGSVANYASIVKAVVQELLTDKQKEELLTSIKEKFQSLDVRGSVDDVTGRIGGFFRNRRSR